MDKKGIYFRFLVENKTEHTAMLAEHGLSIYIEADGKKILFDAGATDIVIANANTLGVELGNVDFAVVSHGHYDHTGGFPVFCKLNQKADIYIHKNAFRDSYGFMDGKPEENTSGIRWTEEEKQTVFPRLKFTDGPLYITQDICITGTVPRSEDGSVTENFYFKDDVGNWVKDDMSHEQCLVIRENEGLYIFSGCSHRGVVSAIEAGKSAFPGEKIAALVAGMHLYNASAEVRKRVVEQIAAERPGKLMPVHCTGIKAICDLKAKFGDSCVVAMAGDEYRREKQ